MPWGNTPGLPVGATWAQTSDALAGFPHSPTHSLTSALARDDDAEIKQHPKRGYIADMSRFLIAASNGCSPFFSGEKTTPTRSARTTP